jgi:hypothetical protein
MDEYFDSKSIGISVSLISSDFESIDSFDLVKEIICQTI